MRDSAPVPAALPVLAAALLAGCASVSSHSVATPDELRRLDAVTVETAAAGTVVRHLTSQDPGAPSGEARPLARIELGADTQRAIAEAVVAAGSRESPLRFQHAGERGDGGTSATLEVTLLTVTLAGGEGADPLTALWLRFQTRVVLPADPGGLAPERTWLDPAYAVAVDPGPRPLSEWLDGEGAKVRAAVATLSAQLAPRLVAGLCGASTASGERGDRATQDRDEPPADAPAASAPGPAPPDETAAPVQIEFLSPAPHASRASTTLRALGGGVGGIFVGGFSGLARCAKAFDGATRELGAALVGLCAIVAVPVGAVIGSVKGVADGAGWGERHEAALRAEQRRKAGVLATAAPAAIAAATAGADEGGTGASRLAGPAGLLRLTRVRLLEDGGDPPVSALEIELELGIGAGMDPRGPTRRLCLRGPGPVPTELWLREDVGLLRASLEAQLARGAELARSGLEPQPGDGPCGPPEPAPRG